MVKLEVTYTNSTSKSLKVYIKFAWVLKVNYPSIRMYILCTMGWLITNLEDYQFSYRHIFKYLNCTRVNVVTFHSCRHNMIVVYKQIPKYSSTMNAFLKEKLGWIRGIFRTTLIQTLRLSSWVQMLMFWDTAFTVIWWMVRQPQNIMPVAVSVDLWKKGDKYKIDFMAGVFNCIRLYRCA